MGAFAWPALEGLLCGSNPTVAVGPKSNLDMSTASPLVALQVGHAQRLTRSQPGTAPIVGACCTVAVLEAWCRSCNGKRSTKQSNTLWLVKDKVRVVVGRVPV